MGYPPRGGRGGPYMGPPRGPSPGSRGGYVGPMLGRGGRGEMVPPRGPPVGYGYPDQNFHAEEPIPKIHVPIPECPWTRCTGISRYFLSHGCW